jgi:flagellar basal-body rod modification protein FlgD
MDPVISSLSSLPAVGLQQAPAARKELDKDSFLLLLTTQMQHQDPLSPLDANAMVAQLAQFSSVEQLENLGRKLDTMLLAQASANQMAVPSLVGKEVLFHADRVALVKGQPAPFQVSLDGPADEVVALITDGSGRVVRTLALGPRPGGAFEVGWDGLDEAGRQLDSGQYGITISATRTDGTVVTAAASVRGLVHGVTFENQAPELLVGGRHVTLGDVIQISSPTT